MMGPGGDARSPTLRDTAPEPDSDGPSGPILRVIETTISPFRCFYQDALAFHTQSRLELTQSEGDSSRLARASLLLYLTSAEALVHQAAAELGKYELSGLLSDPSRPMPLADAWRLLPAICDELWATSPTTGFDPRIPPWPQFAELLALKALWTYPGPPASRRAYYLSRRSSGGFDPMPAHQIPAELDLAPDQIVFPRTGLPRDPYALRPHHLDAARGVLDSAIDALDRRMGGLLTRDQRHRREPTRIVCPTTGEGTRE